MRPGLVPAPGFATIYVYRSERDRVSRAAFVLIVVSGHIIDDGNVFVDLYFMIQKLVRFSSEALQRLFGIGHVRFDASFDLDAGPQKSDPVVGVSASQGVAILSNKCLKDGMDVIQDLLFIVFAILFHMEPLAS